MSSKHLALTTPDFCCRSCREPAASKWLQRGVDKAFSVAIIALLAVPQTPHNSSRRTLC